MTYMEKKLLKKFLKRSPIYINESIAVDYLDKLGLIAIDKEYKTTIGKVIIRYAKTTQDGINVLNSNLKWYNKIPFIKYIFI